MSFPFGGFKDPEKSRKGRYSGAQRNFQEELAFDEGDPDDYKNNLDMIDDPEMQKRWDKEWDEEISKYFDEISKYDLNIRALGQSHMDIAWLWRTYQIVNKSRITHGKAAWHVLNIPEFTFTYSQPLMLDWLRKEDPDTFNLVKEAVKTGRFEIQGGCYVETDGKIPMGESWCRTRLYGQRWYREHFGKIAEIEWLPDSFGYNNNIPQFAHKSGSRYFYTQKITGNWPPDEFPFAHFIWRSPDGSELITYSDNFTYRPLSRWNLFGHTRKILNKGESMTCNYFSEDPRDSPKLGEMYKELCLVYGSGDGGHGPRSNEIHQMRYYMKKGYIKNFIDAMNYFKMYDKIRDQLPIWDGTELFYNLHRGTLTTQGLVKRMNRYFEWTLTGLESLFSIIDFEYGWNNSQATHDSLHWLWKDALLLQFHDILPGSSVPEVYDDCYDIWCDDIPKMEEIEADLFRTLKDSEKHAESEESKNYKIELLNPTDFEGKTFVEIKISADILNKIEDLNEFSIKDSKGKFNPIQHIKEIKTGESLISQPNKLLFIADVENWASSTYNLVKQKSGVQNPIVIEKDDNFEFETEFSKIKVSKATGNIESYFDKNLNKEIFSQPSNAIGVFRDWSMIEQAWNIGQGYREMPFEEEDDEIVFKGISIVENGPVRWALEIEHSLPESETIIKRKLMVYKKLPGLYYQTYFDWKQEGAIVKDHFSFATNTDIAVAEAPYTTELMTCDPDKKGRLEKQRWESCMQTWVAMPSQDRSWGVAILNDCKYGFDIRKDTIGLTLVRGPNYPNGAGYVLEERKKRTDDLLPTHADQEEHIMEYAIIPYTGEWKQGNIQKLAHQFNRRPFSSITTTNLPILKGIQSPIEIDHNNLELVAIKHPENTADKGNSIILRIVENGRMKTTGKFTIPETTKITAVKLLNILEEDWKEKSLTIIKKDGFVSEVTCEWNPHEILTFSVTK